MTAPSNRSRDFPAPDGILRNVTWLGIGSAAVKPIWFAFITFFCLRNVSAEAYGILNWALWLMMVAASFTDLGTSDYVTREVARARDQAWRYFSNFVVVRLGLGVVVLGIVYASGIALGFGPERLQAVTAAGIFTIALLLTTFCRVFFRAFEVLRYEAMSLIAEKLLVVGGGMVMLFGVGTPVATLRGMAAGMTLALLLTLSWVAWRIAPFEFKVIKWSFLKRHLLAAVPLGIFSVFVVAYLRMGPILLDYFEGEAAVGRFGAAFRIVEALLLFPTLVTAALLPRLAQFWAAGSVPEFRALVHRALLGIATATGFVGAMLVLSGDLVIGWLVSEQNAAAYAGSGALLRALGAIYPIICLNVILSMVLIAADQQRFLAQFMVVAAAVTAVIYFIVIGLIGEWGIVVVLAFSEVCVTSLFYLHFRRATAPPS